MLGVLISILAVVVIVFIWGPRSRSWEVDMYSDNSILHKHFLWKSTHTESPKQPHVQWAIEHQEPVKGWYLPVSGMTGSWFGGDLYWDSSSRPYVYEIYSLKIPENEKVNLLHLYHQDLDELKAKFEEYESSLSMSDFNARWDQKLKALDNQDSEESKNQ
ncbi:MAG: hypothetical protein GXY41_11335 [Phycisphaerae bacterium]|nr:hypothetical protein [Phycisphaerae bacterium]